MFGRSRRLSGRATNPGRTRARRLGLEPLEGRALMSLAAEFGANTTTRDAQYDSDNASSADGHSVIVWTDRVSATNRDVRAQLYNNGVATGAEIVIESGATDETQPAVSMDADGDFVVVWTRTQADGTRNIRARLYDSAGSPHTDPFDATDVGGVQDYEPDVAMDAEGGFVVVFTWDTSGGDQDIDFWKFDRDGQPLDLGPRTIARTPQPETRPSIARTPDGRFAVAYQVAQSSTNRDIVLKRFSGGGGSMVMDTIAGTAADELAPSVALDDAGNAVVAWQERRSLGFQFGPTVGSSALYPFGNDQYEIRARRVPRPALMQPLGPVIFVTSTLRSHETEPTVALRRGGGSFVVAYNVSSGYVPGNGIQVVEYSATDAILASHIVSARAEGPAISIDGQDNYLLSFTRYTGTSSFVTDLNVRARRGHL